MYFRSGKEPFQPKLAYKGDYVLCPRAACLCKQRADLGLHRDRLHEARLGYLPDLHAMHEA